MTPEAPWTSTGLSPRPNASPNASQNPDPNPTQNPHPNAESCRPHPHPALHRWPSAPTCLAGGAPSPLGAFALGLPVRQHAAGGCPVAGVRIAGVLVSTAGGTCGETRWGPAPTDRRACPPAPRPAQAPASPKRPGGHRQWNMPASRARHGAPPRQGLGRHGWSPHAPTPELRVTAPCQLLSSSRWLFTSRRRMQPLRPTRMEVLSSTLPPGGG